MSQTLLHQPSSRIILHWSILLICIAGLSGCTTVTIGIPTEVATAEACASKTPNPNIYQINPSTITIDNINMLATSTPDLFTLATPDPNLASINLARARYTALDRLTHEVKRWTDIQSIRVDDTSEVKIMVTLLHPDLIQAVALNNILLNNPNVLNNTAIRDQLDVEVRNALKQFEERNKLIFLITIPKINGSPHTIYMDIHKMYLKNSKNMSVLPDYKEHNLDQAINPSEKSIFGYFYYPFEVMNTTCTEVLSSDYNSWIVIENSSFTIDGAAGVSKTWTIPYKPLLEIEPPYYTPDLPPTDQLNYTPTLPLNDPPQTNLSIEELKNNQGYWSEFGRFVWAQLTFEIYNK